jgi:8-oxo-dGTP diphosphatase
VKQGLVEAVGAVLYGASGDVFLAKRPAGKVLAGKWEFPGGKREQGESLEACLEREIWEELHVEITLKTYIGHRTYPYDYAHVRLHLFAATLKEGETITLQEHPEGRWVKLEEVLAYDTPEIVLPFFDAIASCIKGLVRMS